MHVRFVSPVIDAKTRVELGFINTFFRVENRLPEWIWREIRDQIDWYNDHLDAPEELGRYFKRRRTIWGVCWFKPEAQECIKRAHYCAWLFNEAGIPVRMIKDHIRHDVIWQDHNQVLCKPTRKSPRAFN